MNIIEKIKNINIIIKILLSVALLIIICGGIYIANIDSTKIKQDTQVIIPNGSSAKQISEILSENSIIKNKLAFRIYIKKEDVGTKLHSGTYKFLAGKVTFKDITDKLIKGTSDSTKTIDITIPEGLTVLQIAEVFEKEGVVNKDKFLEYAKDLDIPYSYIKKTGEYTQLEGFLFPETYNISLEWTEKEIIEKMLKQFDKVWSDEYQKRAEKLSMSVQDVITVASLIEREAKVDSERSLIASVIYNRIKIDMPLQIDATIQYALGKQKERLLYKDLEINSPYNTYKNKGLPPTPISNVGEESIKASLYPKDTEYLYYRTKNNGSGEHSFATTFNEHINNGSED